MVKTFFSTFTFSNKLIFLVLAALTIGIICNPFTSVNALLLGAMLIIAGQALLKEKLILAFLAVRPWIDYWRDLSVFTWHNHSVNLNAIFGILFVGWGLLQFVIYRRNWVRPPAWFAYIALTLFMFASAIYSVSALTTLIEATKYLSIIIMFGLMYFFIKEKIISQSQMIKSIALGAIVPISVAIIQVITNSGMKTFDVQGRIDGSFAHPNVFAFYCLYLIILAIQYLFIEKKYWQKEKYAVLGLLLTLLAFTYTRAAWIGLLVFTLVIGVLHFRKIFWAIIILVVGFYTSLYPIDYVLRTQFNTTIEKSQLIRRLTLRNEDADSLTWRNQVAAESIHLIYAHKWLGYGYGTFPLVWDDNKTNDHLWDDSSEAHNDYLRFALEIGFVGLALYGMVLARLLFVAWQMYYDHRHKHPELYVYTAGWICVFGVLSLSDNIIHHMPATWMAMACWGAMFGSYARPPKPINFLIN